MTIVWIDGAPYNEFGEQLFIWRCDGTVKTGPGGGILLCPTYPCEDLVVTPCCANGTLPTLTISWTNSTGGLVEGSGGAIGLTWNPTGGEGSGGYQFNDVVPGSTNPNPQAVAGSCEIADELAETTILGITTNAPYGTTSEAYPCAGPVNVNINPGFEQGTLEFIGITALDAILTG